MKICHWLQFWGLSFVNIIYSCFFNEPQDAKWQNFKSHSLELLRIVLLIVVCYLQYWMLSKTGEIRRDEACLDYAGTDVILYPCHGGKGNQVWF